MNVSGIVFSNDELKRLKNIERNTNRLKELGLWEYAPKKPKGKVSRQHTVSLGRKSSLVEKVTMVWTCFLTLIYMINFNFWINFNCLLRQRLTMNN